MVLALLGDSTTTRRTPVPGPVLFLPVAIRLTFSLYMCTLKQLPGCRGRSGAGCHSVRVLLFGR